MTDSMCGIPDNLAAGGCSFISKYVWDVIVYGKTVP